MCVLCNSGDIAVMYVTKLGTECGMYETVMKYFVHTRAKFK